MIKQRFPFRHIQENIKDRRCEPLIRKREGGRGQKREGKKGARNEVNRYPTPAGYNEGGKNAGEKER